ncbi:glycosyltransferase 87 family protein [Rhodococcus sp. TAF43]|uniref:glycosyltransferase 87 family protein n=1 Tax=unclassified Rhodococcus (in: high G+C Gram-positive bacteria) TaxID=192944 RepID=UPI000E0C6301|nr:glycosyltransferase 87 family protein [Rhodococcus sp. AG1013]
MVHTPTPDSADRSPAAAADSPSATSRRRSPVVVLSRVAIVLACAVGAVYHLFGIPGLRDVGFYYRIDLDVYRLGGSVFAAGGPLYGSMPPTQSGIGLPFTYPPLAAVVFSPMSAISLEAAGVVLTALSLVALFATLVLTLASIGISPRSTLVWTALAAAAAALTLEPVYSTLDYGQVNILLMVFVAADCLLKKTPWPRGMLIGFVAAVKLTPAVFVLFFLLRKDFRAAVTTGLSFVGFGAIGFVVARADSWQYWTDTLLDSGRIGGPAYPANQSITGVLARLGLDPSVRSVLWLLLSAAALVLAGVAMWRAFAAGAAALALFVNALLGLLVSPVSWSHHWVWVAPLLLLVGVEAYRRRSLVLGAGVVASGAIFVIAPHWRLGHGRWEGTGWPVWDQFLASSYVWWAIAVIAAVAVHLGRRRVGEAGSVAGTTHLTTVP